MGRTEIQTLAYLSLKASTDQWVLQIIDDDEPCTRNASMFICWVYPSVHVHASMSVRQHIRELFVDLTKLMHCDF